MGKHIPSNSFAVVCSRCCGNVFLTSHFVSMDAATMLLWLQKSFRRLITLYFNVWNISKDSRRHYRVAKHDLKGIGQNTVYEYYKHSYSTLRKILPTKINCLKQTLPYRCVCYFVWKFYLFTFENIDLKKNVWGNFLFLKILNQ